MKKRRYYLSGSRSVDFLAKSRPHEVSLLLNPNYTQGNSLPMVDILPFRGVRYDPAAAGAPLSALVAPPYDVISPAEQDALYNLNPANVVRLILGREEDKYAQAGRLFREWLASGTLKADEEPSLYVYHQTFDDPATGKAFPDRIGLICLLKLEEYSSGKVLPHEKTLTAAKADRLELLRATEAQFESIYGLYSDPDNSVQSFLREYDDRETVIERVDGAIGSSHRIEKISDPSAHAILQDLLADTPVFIADGHHRYETALNYRREAGSPAADYILITLTAFEDEGLLVLPTHRLVKNVPPEKIAALPSALSVHFTLTPSTPETVEAAIAAKAELGQVAFGVVLPPGEVHLATLNATAAELPGLVSGPGSDAVKRLPVTLLGNLILDQCLGIDAAAVAAGTNVSYKRELTEAVAAVQDGTAQAAFLLGRPTVNEIKAVSLAGDVMPQKSTFFYPKLLSGLVLRDLTLDDLAEASRPHAD
jgi:uncharacterized protein (DUF1015 family)